MSKDDLLYPKPDSQKQEKKEKKKISKSDIIIWGTFTVLTIGWALFVLYPRENRE